MNMGKAATVGVVLALAIVGAGYWLSGPVDRKVEVGKELPSANNVTQLDTEQRLSRLEDEIRALKDLVSNDVRDTRRSTRQPERTESGNTTKSQEKFKATLSSSFAAQPVDTTWARRTRIELEERLIATAAEQPDFPAPRTARMQCRSTTCRIEADYPDEDSALYGVQVLQSAFSSSLPRAHQYSVNNPDGSVTIVMYASKGPT